jgi:nicotinamide/nicotinate riboside kinase
MDTLPPPPVFLGISGCPSSGKSTLAYLLALIYPDSILLHADDFPTDAGVPMLPPPLNCLDSDSVFGVDFHAMYKVLDHTKAIGKLPDRYGSWFQNNIMTIEQGQKRVRDTDAINIEAVRKSLERLLQETGNTASTSTVQKILPRLVILEGFLVYHDPEIRKRLDMMLFLRLSKATARARRLAKPGWGKDAKPAMYWASEPFFEASV